MAFNNSGTGVNNLSSKSESIITINSLASGYSIKFLAFVTDFTDSYKSEWTSQAIYGRMDPVSIFKNTVRKISLAFDVPSNNLQDSKNNASNADKLIQSLYPIYNQDVKGVSILSSPPLFRIKFSNLIYNASPLKNTSQAGLLGFLDGFDFKPVFESGVFTEGGNIFPKLYKVSLNYNVIHEHPLGNVLNGSQPVPRLGTETEISNNFPHNYAEGTIEGTPPKPKTSAVESTGASTGEVLQSRPQNVSSNAVENSAESNICGGP